MVKEDIIQFFVNMVGGDDYLEIGIAEGDCYKQIKAKHKMGVDPFPKYWDERIYKMTSDEFFSTKRKIDGVIFVDGLHTYEQSLRDVENSLRVMTDRSVILMHDVKPQSASEAADQMAYEGASWMGDVWKTVLHLRTLRDDLIIYTFNIPCGLTVIHHGKPEIMLKPSTLDFKSLDFPFFERNFLNILNIKEPLMVMNNA